LLKGRLHNKRTFVHYFLCVQITLFMQDKNFLPTGFGSAAVHAGHELDDCHAHLVPIYASSTFVYDTAEQGMQRFSGAEPGYIYSRWGNPTFAEAERKIAALEALV
jgi:methionine-gamma-lyase